MPQAYTLGEITSLDDPLLLPWLDLYETAFPPEERVFTSLLLGGVKTPGKYHMLAAVDESRNLAGMAFYSEEIEAKAAFLWYLAISPALRNHGIGAWLYRAVLQRLDANDLAMFLDVDIPEEARTEAERDLSRRRIGFYQRLGARLLSGIRLVQRVEEHLPEIKTYLMVHPVQPLDAQAACDIARIFLGEDLTFIGELRFEN